MRLSLVIREAAKRMLYVPIVKVLNSNLLSEKYFVEKITQGFVKKNGNCFKEFLGKYQDKVIIEDCGGKLILYDVHDSVMFLICSMIECFGDLFSIVRVFIYMILTKMGKNENYLSNENKQDLENYLDSLM
jgi:hypothetical protein